MTTVRFFPGCPHGAKGGSRPEQCTASRLESATDHTLPSRMSPPLPTLGDMRTPEYTRTCWVHTLDSWPTPRNQTRTHMCNMDTHPRSHTYTCMHAHTALSVSVAHPSAHVTSPGSSPGLLVLPHRRRLGPCPSPRLLTLKSLMLLRSAAGHRYIPQLPRIPR